MGCVARTPRFRRIDGRSTLDFLPKYPSDLEYQSMKSDERGRGYRLPLLPLRDIIVFPHMVVPLFVGRDKSLSALEEAMAGDKQLLLAAQRRAKTDDPNDDDLDANAPSDNQIAYVAANWKYDQVRIGLELSNWVTSYSTLEEGDANHISLWIAYYF